VRQLRSEFNDKFGLSWAVIQPVAFILLLGLVRGRIDGGLTHGMDTFAFMMLGMVPIKALMLGLGKVSTALKRDKPLYAFRQVQPISSLITATMLQMSISIAVIFVLWVLCFLADIDLEMSDPLTAMVLMALLYVLLFAIGVFFAIAEQFVPEISKVRELFTMPMLFISGVFFSLQDIPEDLWFLLIWNPFLHIVELLRHAAYPEFSVNGVSLSYVLVVTMVSLFFSMAIYFLNWKRAVSI